MSTRNIRFLCVIRKICIRLPRVEAIIKAVENFDNHWEFKIIPDSRIRHIISKGPTYRFPSSIYFNKCREEIAAALNEFNNRWCK